MTHIKMTIYVKQESFNWREVVEARRDTRLTWQTIAATFADKKRSEQRIKMERKLTHFKIYADTAHFMINLN